MADRVRAVSRFAVPLGELEASTHVDVSEQVESVPDRHAENSWTSWDEQVRMLHLVGAGIG